MMKPGFYWAKWRSAAPGTEDNGEGCMGEDATWEIVEVWENSLDPTDPEYLMVHVGGVAKGQGVHCFEFAPGGPLKEPS